MDEHYWQQRAQDAESAVHAMECQLDALQRYTEELVRQRDAAIAELNRVMLQAERERWKGERT